MADITRTIERFATQPPVVTYAAPAPKNLRGLALQAELIAAGLPERVDVSACGDEVRVAILDDESNDWTSQIAKAVKAHKGIAHPKEREHPDVVTKAI